MSVWDPRNSSDHYLVLGCLRGNPLREYPEYLGRRKRLPLQPPTTPTREDGLFSSIHRSVPKSKARKARKKVWILASTWRLFNERVFTRRDLARNQTLIQRLGRAIAAKLKGGWRRRAEKAAKEVERLLGLEPALHQEAWHRMEGWY